MIHSMTSPGPGGDAQEAIAVNFVLVMISSL